MANEKDLKKLGVGDLDVDGGGGGIKFVIEEHQVLDLEPGVSIRDLPDHINKIKGRNDGVFIKFYEDDADYAGKPLLVRPVCDDTGNPISLDNHEHARYIKIAIDTGLAELGA